MSKKGIVPENKYRASIDTNPAARKVKKSTATHGGDGLGLGLGGGMYRFRLDLDFGTCPL